MVRLTDRPDMTLDVYRGRKTTMQQQQFSITFCLSSIAMANNFSDSWLRHLCRLQNIILQFSCRKIYNLESLPFFTRGGGGGGGEGVQNFLSLTHCFHLATTITTPGPRDYKKKTCLTEIFLLINVKMPTNVGILKF